MYTTCSARTRGNRPRRRFFLEHLIIMETTFDHIWQLLKPAVEFSTRGRIEACRRLWESFDLERQRYTYRTIRDKKRCGEFVHENPYFAIEDNSRAPRQSLAILQPPTNYAGKSLPRTGEFYFADYNGKRGLYKREDVEAHHMSNPEKFEL